MTRLPSLLALGLTACLLGASCGGGSSGGSTSGSLNVQPVWEQPGGGSNGGGTGSQLPSAVITVRLVFTSDAGLRCCLAVDPHSVPLDSASGLRLLVLDALPAGPGTLSLAGYATDFAPAPTGVTDVCPTSPANVGHPCDTTRLATPSFESDPQTVTITPGTRVISPTITVHALPFLIDLQPGQGDSVASPVAISFTAVDAAIGINPDSMAVDASFRSLTKRLPITLTACDDRSSPPCSTQGAFQVSGFHAAAAPLQLPAGVVSLHIVAQDQSSPPKQVDFSYNFTVPQPAGGSASGQAAYSAQRSTQPPATLPGSEVLPPVSSGSEVASVPDRPTVTPTPISLLCPTPTSTVTPTVEQPAEGFS